MATNRTISIRLGIEDAATVKAALESVGATGTTAFDKLESGLKRLGAVDSGAMVGALQRIEAQAKATAAAVAQSQVNAFAGVTSGTSADDYAKRAADVAAWGAAIDTARAKFVPMDGAMQQARASLQQIGEAFRDNILSADEVGVATTNVTAKYRAMVAAAEESAAATRLAAAAQGQSIANTFAGVKTQDIAGDAAAYAARAADMEAYGQQLDAMRAKFNPVYAASKQYETALDEIAAAERVGAISAQEAAAAVERSTAAFAAGQNPLTAHASKLAEVERTSGAAAASQRNLTIQVIQGVSGIASGQPVLTTFIQQGHQVVDGALAMGTGFGGVATAAKGMFNAMGGFPVLIGGAVLAAFVGLTSAAERQSTRLADLRQQLRATHDDYAALATSVETASRRVAATTSETLSQAQAAAQTIAGAKYFAGTTADLSKLTAISGDLARVWNVDVSVAAGRLRDAINDPAAAARKFGEEGMTAFSGVNAGVVTTVEGLQRAGDQAGAFALVLKGLGTASAGATQDESKLSKAMHDLQTAMFGAQDGSKSFATSIGEALTVPVVGAVRILTGLVEVLKSVKDAASAIPSIGSKVSALAAQGGVDNDGMPVGSATGQAASVPSPARLTPSASQQDFIATWGNAAQMAGKELGISATTVLGQWASETRWGQAVYGYNAGNIKAQGGYTGASQTLPDGLQYRAYASPEAFAKDYIALLQTDRYAAVRNTGSDALATGTALKQAGYMENPNGARLIADTAASVRARAPGLDTGGMVDNGRALADQLPKLIEGTRAIKEVNLPQELEKVEAEMARVAKTTGVGSTEYLGLVQRQQELNAELYKNVDAQTEANRASESGLRANAGLTAAEVALNSALEQRRQLALNTGTSFTDADAAKVAADLTAKQVQELDRLNFSMANTAANSIQMARAYDGGNQSVVDATAKQAAYNQALAMFVPGTDGFRTAYKQLVDGYKQVALAAAEAQVAQQNAQGRDNLAYIQAETSTLGMNEDARTKLLAVMKAEQDMHRKFGDVLPEEAKAYIELTKSQADASAAYQHQKADLDELSGFFDHTFSTIADSITSAMATGELSMAKLQDVGKAVVSSLVAEFAKLALLNPLKNAFFGGTSPTLSSVGGLLGSLLGNGGSEVATGALAVGSGVGALLVGGNAGVGDGLVLNKDGNSVLPSELTAEDKAAAGQKISGTELISTGSALVKGADWLSGGKLLEGAKAVGGDLLSSAKDFVFKSVGYTPGQSLGGWATSLIGEAGTLTATGLGTAAAGAATAATAAGVSAGGVAAATTAATVAGQEVIGTVGLAVNTVTKALPYIGAAITIITDLATGNLRGAAIVATTTATGALIGSVIPGVGTAIGAAVGATVGVLIDTFFPQHPKNPYQDTAVDIAGGKVVRGLQVHQLEKLGDATSQVDTFADAVNSYTEKVGLILTNADGNLGHVGNNIKGLPQAASVSELFERLKFDTDPNAADAGTNFGIARHAVAGMTFKDPVELSNELLKIAGFSDAMDVLGIHLKSVGQDLTSITIASVDLQNALGQSSDLRTALAHDLPNQVFANQDALSAEIEKVNQFVNGTIPGLLNPVMVSTSSMLDAVNANNLKYKQAMDQAAAYGLDTAALLEAQYRADDMIVADARKALDRTMTTTADAAIQASGADPATKFEASMRDLAIQQDQQREALIKSLTDVYGDAVKSTQYYLDQVATLNNTLAEQAKKAAADYAKQMNTAALSLVATRSSIIARLYSAAGDDKDAELVNYDAKAAQERDSYSSQLLEFYGANYAATQEYGDRLSELETVQQAERLAIVRKYGDATTQAATDAAKAQADALKQAQTNVGGLFTNLTSYVNKLQTGSDSPLSATDQYALATSRFNAVSGAAAAGDYHSASQLQDYADTFLSASRAVNGSGAGYASDFQRVIDAVSSVSDQADALTVSSQREIMQENANQITGGVSLADLKASLEAGLLALERRINQQTRVLAA